MFPKLFGLSLCLLSVSALVQPPATNSPITCQKTEVLILGAGMAGISAAVSCFHALPEMYATNKTKKALTENGVEDFIIVEYNSEIGGRCRHTKFGQDESGDPYTVELGANWVWETNSLSFG